MKTSPLCKRLHSRLLPLLFLLISLPGLAGERESFPSNLDGSMMPYDFSAVDSLPVIPAGYEPVHISYVARHGARFLSSRKKVEKIEKELLKGEQDGILSADGRRMLNTIAQIEDSTAGRWGLLSSVGIGEEQKLGCQMAEMFPALLEKGRMNTVSTFVPRVVMTMYEFNHAVERRHTDLEIYTSSGHQNDSLLYFFDVFTGYRNFRNEGVWKKIYDDFVARHVSAAPARRLFTETDLSEKKLRDLTMEMYGALQGDRAAGFAPTAGEFFTEEEYRECWRASNLKHYLRNTPNALDPSCTTATAVLIRRIISDADSALEANASGENKIPFSGYFGHAETLLPFLSVMNIPGCFYPFTNYENIDSKWKLEEITPLGANLALIFMRDAEGVVYVSVRHNGRNVPAYPGAPDVMKWSDLKAYWLMRIDAPTRPKLKDLSSRALK